MKFNKFLFLVDQFCIKCVTDMALEYFISLKVIFLCVFKIIICDNCLPLFYTISADIWQPKCTQLQQHYVYCVWSDWQSNCPNTHENGKYAARNVVENCKCQSFAKTLTKLKAHTSLTWQFYCVYGFVLKLCSFLIPTNVTLMWKTNCVLYFLDMRCWINEDDSCLRQR